MSSAHADADVRALSARLSQIEDELAITRVLYRYAHTIDYGNEADWLDCFTADAVWEARNMQTGQVIMRHESHAELLLDVRARLRLGECTRCKAPRRS